MGTFICRTYAKAAVACGSMVLFFFCRSLFRPGGRNKDLQRVRNSWFASVLISWVLHCSLCKRTIKHKNGVVVRYRMVNSRLASLEYQGAPKLFTPFLQNIE